MKLKMLAFLIDLDNCLIDADGLKKTISKTFYSKLDKEHKVDFEKIYESARTPTGLVDITLVIKRLAEKLGTKNLTAVGDIFYKQNFKKYLFKDTLTVLKQLKRLGDVNILSMGDKHFQETKIEKSGMGKIIGKGKTIIVTDKKSGIVKILKDFKKQYEDVVIIDDRADVLEAAIKKEPLLATVWLNRGRYKDIRPKDPGTIAFTAKNLTEIYLFLNKFVGKIKKEDATKHLLVTLGITKSQQDQLIRYSKADEILRKYTKDFERFADKRSFAKWASQGKTIYTLTNHKQDLLGIIWFSKKSLEKYEHTFAVRMYGEARGKKISKKFMDFAFLHFGSRKVWLDVSADNFIAIKLYKSFGFKQISSGNDRITMALKD